jgi:hypothetical protein
MKALAVAAAPSYNSEMTVGPELLILSGQALYGDRWQSPLSRDLGVTDRTVRNWSANKYDCPPDLTERLLALLRTHGKNVDLIISLLELNMNGTS